MRQNVLPVKRVQLTLRLQAEVRKAVDRERVDSGLSRSEWIENALIAALRRRRLTELEARRK
jgi:hypothetical protein